jgi:hypothetical protein
MSCSLPCFQSRAARGVLERAHGGRDGQVGAHILFVKIPPRTVRGRRWALSHGIGEVDVAALTAMVRAERLSAG